MMQNQRTTDWDTYYRKPFWMAKFTRAVLRRKLMRIMKKFLPGADVLEIAELGGGASCYAGEIMRRFPVRTYHVFDNNAESLKMFAPHPGLVIHETDLLASSVPDLNCDLVFSGGLIEHFSPEDTAAMIRTHFRCAASGGLVILLFPTPSVSYRVTRFFAELTGKWIFHDERPLKTAEVLATAAGEGSLLYRTTVHSILLSQTILVFRKN